MICDRLQPLRFLLAVAFFVGCGAVQPSERDMSPEGIHCPDAVKPLKNDDDLESLYRMAIEDAAIAVPNEVHDLKLPHGDRVTVLTWVKNEVLAYYPVGEMTTFSRWIWVTLPPEVQEKCRQFNVENRSIRLQQLLGLPPTTDSDRSFVIMETDRENLFRPCIAPDIATSQCPVSGETGDGAHGVFFANQTVVAYSNTPGYPWTRLGYTYDWHPETPEYGASEYVIRKNVPVIVKKVVPTATYCAP